MLSHRLQVTKSPSGSAGHVGHMSACGCLGFPTLDAYANTHTHTDCCYAHVCIHTYTIVLHLHHRTHRSPLNVTHCVCVEGWYRVLGFSLNRASLFFLRDKVQGQSSLPIIESGSLSNLWSCCSEGASGKMLREKGDVIRINSSDCCL